MTRVWPSGPLEDILPSLQQAGLEINASPQGCDAALVKTFAQQGDELQSLEGSIGLMKNALDEAEANGITKMVVLSDLAALEGRRWQSSPDHIWTPRDGASLSSVHGMGQLTVEIFAQLAARRGISTILARVGDYSQNSLIDFTIKAIQCDLSKFDAEEWDGHPKIANLLITCLDDSGRFSNEHGHSVIFS